MFMLIWRKAFQSRVSHLITELFVFPFLRSPRRGARDSSSNDNDTAGLNPNLNSLPLTFFTATD